MITIPPDFIRSTIEREGSTGRAWINALPEIVAGLCADWGLEVDGLAMHGYLGLVVPVRRQNELCALKVSWIDDSSADEALALAAWNGRGAVRLLDIRPEQGALLLERLDATRSLETLAIDQALMIAGRLLRRLAIPAPENLRSLRDVAAELARTLPERWEQYGRPMPRRTLDLACEIAGQYQTSTRLLVNYDLHYADVLSGTREPWLAVDPKVVAGILEYGPAQLFWCRLEDIQAQGGLARHFDALVEAAELDPELARAWTLVRCVDYWLWGLSAGLTYDPARCEVIVGWLTVS